MLEEFAQDPPFIGRKRDLPQTSFRINRDCFAGYFIVVRPADNDPKSLWLARAITNPNSDPCHIHQIQIQYWMPALGRHIDMDTYAG